MGNGNRLTRLYLIQGDLVLHRRGDEGLWSQREHTSFRDRLTVC